MEASENKSLFDRREAILGDESLSPSQKIEQFVELARDAVSFLESGQSIRETSLHNFFATIKATVIEFEGDGVEFSPEDIEGIAELLFIHASYGVYYYYCHDGYGVAMISVILHALGAALRYEKIGNFNKAAEANEFAMQVAQENGCSGQDVRDFVFDCAVAIAEENISFFEQDRVLFARVYDCFVSGFNSFVSDGDYGFAARLFEYTAMRFAQLGGDEYARYWKGRVAEMRALEERILS